MTVEQLIAKLQSFPPHAIVVLYDQGDWGTPMIKGKELMRLAPDEYYPFDDFKPPEFRIDGVVLFAATEDP